MKILVLNGPNLNMLGVREPAIYGRKTYADVVAEIEEKARELQVECAVKQSNHEGALVDMIQSAYHEGVDGIVINPAAYTHTSVAIADALKTVSIPTVEIHISDPDTRESFRHVSYIRPIVIATVKGEGTDGYLHALTLLVEYLNEKAAKFDIR